MHYVSDVIAEYIRDSAITKYKVAVAMGVSRSVITNISTAKNYNPTVNTIEKFCRFFSIEMSDFFKQVELKKVAWLDGLPENIVLLLIDHKLTDEFKLIDKLVRLKLKNIDPAFTDEIIIKLREHTRINTVIDERE